MKHQLLINIILCGLIYIATFNAYASVVHITPEITSVKVNDLITLSVEMDFNDAPTVGGGFDVFFDPTLLQFSSFTFDVGLGDDPLLRRLPDLFSGELNGIGFGDFAGLSGPSIIGELKFTAISEGIALVNLASSDSITGPFVSASLLTPQDVDFTSTEITIAPLVVPIPPAFILFTGAISLLSFMPRRKSSNNL